jgi:peroxin-5
MMNEFMQQPTQLPGPGESAWKMDKMMQSLPQNAPHADQQWAAEFDPGMQGPAMQQNAGPAFSANDFARFQNASPVTAEQRAASPIGGASGLMGYRPMMGTYGMNGMGMMGMQQNFSPAFSMQQAQQQGAMGKGKSRVVELDDKEWEAQFAQLEQADQTADLDKEANAAIEQELNQLDRSVADKDGQLETETDHFGDFESIWRGIQAETKIARELAAEEDYFPDGLGIDDWNDFDGLNLHHDLPNMGPYLFEQQNPFEDRTDPYAEGVEIMDSGGNLSLAALAFEAAVRKNPDHVDAWVRLGAAQAQNEKEIPSIRALEHALQRDPDNIEALMALAVSYTNEGYETSAYRTLERWVSVKYPQVVTGPIDAPKEIGFTERIALQQKVTDLFIKAAQLSPSGESMDPDVQVGLGVLFYAADEFEKAIDCFEAALTSTEAGVVNSKQNMHLLWNRLGATMANSGRSEEAIQAYERALEFRPNFVRARYNLGVSCINMGVLPEAAGHLLGALEMHRVDELEGRQKAREIVEGAGGNGNVSDGDLDRLITQNQSTNLYDTLRRVFTNMGRRDLTERVGPGMDPRQFRGEFDF